MDYWPAGILIVGSISIYYSYSYFKKRLEKYIINKVMIKLNDIANNEEIKFQQFQKSTSALVLFDHGGKSHKLCIPFDQSKAQYMRRKEAYLIKNGEKIEITHKPGVPYLLSAGDMSGDKIIIEKDGKIIKEYEKNEVPKYLDN